MSKQETKRKAQCSLDTTSDDHLDDETDESPSKRPLGVKKAKTVLALKNNQESFLQEFRNQQASAEKIQTDAAAHRDKMVTDLVLHMEELAKTSFDNFQSVVQESTRQVSQSVKVKLILETDWSVMGKKLRGRMRRTMQKYFEDALEHDGESLDSTDEEDGKMPAKKS